MIHNTKHFFFGVLVFLSQSIFAQDPNFHIYLAFGQSNMDGAGDIEAQDKQAVDARFKNLSSVNCTGRVVGEWYTGNTPLGRCTAGLSPVDYFGRTMVEKLPSHISVGVAVVAVAGSKIELFDKDTYKAYADTAPSWMQGWISEFNGYPYGRLLEMGKKAQEVGVIKGILLHQGESNNGEGDKWLPKVQKIYDDLMADLKLDPTQVPLLAGELVGQEEGGICWYHNQAIAKLHTVIPNTHVISSKGLPDKGDGFHFTSASYRTFGARYAETMLSLLELEDVVQTPYKDTLQIPGMIQVEDYDVGGQGVAYSDADPVNSGGTYRTDGVDIDTANGQYVLGWAEQGEWLEWTVKVASTDTLAFTARVAAAGESGKFSLSLDGLPITSSISVPNTGAWNQFLEIKGSTTVLSAGVHILRLNIESAYFNMDWIRFEDPTTSLLNSTIPSPQKLNSNVPLFDLLGRYTNQTRGSYAK